jgi:hypothetical protein
MRTEPLLPALAVPELKNKVPLAPEEPPLVLRILMTPLVVAVPSPDVMNNDPPVLTMLRPAFTMTAPPAPLVPLPTLSTMAPARPTVATPDPTITAPLLPERAVPELKYSAPLPPAAPPFVDRMRTLPLVVAVPSPENMYTVPPVFAGLTPPAT